MIDVWEVRAEKVQSYQADVYSWRCPHCKTVNATHRPPGDNYPRGRCGKCHRVLKLLAPETKPEPKPSKRAVHRAACARER